MDPIASWLSRWAMLVLLILLVFRRIPGELGEELPEKAVHPLLQVVAVAVGDMPAPALVGLPDRIQRHPARVHQSAVFVQMSAHVVDALGPDLADHFARLGEIGVVAEEIYPVFQREDLGLGIEAQPQGFMRSSISARIPLRYSFDSWMTKKSSM